MGYLSEKAWIETGLKINSPPDDAGCDIGDFVEFDVVLPRAGLPTYVWFTPRTFVATLAGLTFAGATVIDQRTTRIRVETANKLGSGTVQFDALVLFEHSYLLGKADRIDDDDLITTTPGGANGSVDFTTLAGFVTGPASSADLEGVVFDGTTGKLIKGSGSRIYPPSATDPAGPPVPQDGDEYYNTALKMKMFYDASRSKWLSVIEATLDFGRLADTAAGSYYRANDSVVFSASDGRYVKHNGTITGMEYTRADSDAATFEVTRNGVLVPGAFLASSAVAGNSAALDADFAANGVLGVRNQSGGNTVTDANGYVSYRWRA